MSKTKLSVFAVGLVVLVVLSGVAAFFILTRQNKSIKLFSCPYVSLKLDLI